MGRILKSPIAWFVAVLVIFAFRNGMAAAHGEVIQTNKLDALLLGYITAWWMARDVRNKENWPSDWTMIFYPIVFPIYLIATRKWKGLAWLVLLLFVLALVFGLPQFFLNENPYE